MLYRFKILGETPAKKNSRIVLKNGRNIPSKNYQQWHEGAMLQLFSQKQIVKCGIISKPCTIRLSFMHGDLRRRDSDNGCSSIMDLLVDCGILEDDNWQIVQNIQIKNSYEKDNAFCIVEIEVDK